MRRQNVGTQTLFRVFTIAALAAFVSCGPVGLMVTPIFAGNAEREVLPNSEGVDEYLKQTKPPTPEEKAGVTGTKLCPLRRAPWTECRNHRLYQCRQMPSATGPLVCNYRNTCTKTGGYC